MSAFNWFRHIHKWFALGASLPLLVMFITGIALSISPKVSFLQPPAVKPANPSLALSFEQILVAAKTHPQAGIQSWDDVVQIDVRPKSGVIRLRARNYWEVQIDGLTGQVLAAAPRWKTLFILLHDGSWFASWVKTWIFFPSGMAALVLWISGLAIWLIPKLKKRGKRK